MKKTVRSVNNIIIVGMIGVFLIASPYLLKAQNPVTGTLVGYVFDQDGTSPLKDAVVTIKNITTGKTYKSEGSDFNGMVRIENIEKGVYQYGVTTSKGDFNSDNLIGIQEGNTANVSIVLSPYDEKEAQAVDQIYQNVREDGEALVGRVEKFDPVSNIADIFIIYGFLQQSDRIHVKGNRTDYYQDVSGLVLDGTTVEKAFAGTTVKSRLERNTDVGDLVYVICKKSGALPLFLTHPCGIAALVAGAGFVTLGIIELNEEVTVSPYQPSKKK